jgi:hypothetical protein
MITLPEGPEVYVSVFVCKDVLREEATGIVSAIRILDTVTVEIPEGVDAFTFNSVPFRALISYRSNAPCSFMLGMSATGPSGERADRTIGEFHSQGGVEGGLINADISVRTELEGTYWFELFVNNEIATKIPLRIAHEFSIKPPDSISWQQPQPTKTTEPSAC